jgi:hypothetical protein
VYVAPASPTTNLTVLTAVTVQVPPVVVYLALVEPVEEAEIDPSEFLKNIEYDGIYTIPKGFLKAPTRIVIGTEDAESFINKF